MDPFRPKTLATATVLASLLAYRATKKKTLTPGGALTGFSAGFLLVATGLRGMTLFFFYQVGSWATNYKKAIKEDMDSTAREASVRGAGQVLAVTVMAVSLSLYHAVVYGPEQPWDMDRAPGPTRVAAAVLAHHAISLGDTLASELGMVFPQTPVLITAPWKRVPRGTNGGITVPGTVMSILGGVLVGGFTLCMDTLSGLPVPPASLLVRLLGYAGISGGLGSAVDSLLGATVQTTYYDEDTKLVHHEHDEGRPKTAYRVAGLVSLLTNEQVNFVSTAISVVACGWCIAPFMLKTTTTPTL